jgi:hypothetical protein
MKNPQKKNLIEFEKFLTDAVNKGDNFPLTDEEIIEILDNFGPPDHVEDFQDEEFILLMKRTHERRAVQKRKLNNPTAIRSLGELLNCFCEFYKVSTERLSSFLGLTIKEFNNILHNKITPNHIGRSRILTICEFTNLSINDMIGILDRTVKLIKININTNLAASNARTDKGISESDRSVVTLDAMQELLLAIEEPNENDKESYFWSEFKDSLREQADREKSPFNLVHSCYTLMRDRSSTTLLNQLSKQL